MVRLASILLLWLLPGPAAANGRFPASGQIAFHPGDLDVIVAQTTFGLVISRDGGEAWDWVCEDVLPVGAVEDPPLSLTADGRVLVAASGGLRRSTPDLCSFDAPSAGLAGVTIQDLVRDPTTPMTTYLITGEIGTPNGVWRSPDDGGTWVPLAGSFDEVLETVEVAPSDPQVLYAAGATSVHGSMDGGEMWGSFVVDVSAYGRALYLAAVDPMDPARVYARADGEATDSLLVSDDGGEHWREVLRAPSLLGFARSADGATIWSGGPGSGLWRSGDRGERFERIGDFSPACLAAREGELWACGDQVRDGFAIGVSVDGGMTFEPKLRLAEVRGPIGCPGGSQVAGACNPIWPTVALLLGAGVMDAGPEEADAGGEPMPAEEEDCGCSAPGARRADGVGLGALGVLALACLLLRRRGGVCAGIVAAGLACLGATAQAQDQAAATAPRTSSLSWIRLPGAEECVAGRQLAEAVERRLGRSVFVSTADADLAVEGRAERDGTRGWRASIALSGANGEAMGERTLDVAGADCAALTEPVALVIAVMIDPEATPPGDGGGDAEREPDPEVVVQERVVVERERVEVPVPVPAPAPRWEVQIEGSGGASFGVIGDAAPMIAGTLYVVPPGFVGLELGLGVAYRETTAAGAGAELGHGFASALICPLAAGDDLSAALCGGLTAGAVRVSGSGADAEEHVTIDLAVRGRLVWHPLEWLALVLRPTLTLPFRRESFVWNGDVLHTPWVITPMIDLGVGVRFR